MQMLEDDSADRGALVGALQPCERNLARTRPLLQYQSKMDSWSARRVCSQRELQTIILADKFHETKLCAPDCWGQWFRPPENIRLVTVVHH